MCVCVCVCVCVCAHRRPNYALGDGYFVGRYINETVSLELETSLLSQLTTATYRIERDQLASTAEAASAAGAAAIGAGAAGAGLSDMQTNLSAWMNADLSLGLNLNFESGAAWVPGLPAGLVYGAAVRGGEPRGLFEEGALMAGVGAGAAGLPTVLRRVVNQLADTHQV